MSTLILLNFNNFEKQGYYSSLTMISACRGQHIPICFGQFRAVAGILSEIETYCPLQATSEQKREFTTHNKSCLIKVNTFIKRSQKQDTSHIRTIILCIDRYGQPRG